MPEFKMSANKVSPSISDEDMKKLLSLLESVKFGSITLIIQGGKVVQMEKNEKMRLK